jgi:hypothetical protein
VRLSASQRRAFLDRHGERLPLLAASGRLVLGVEGPWRWAELYRAGAFVVGYEWRHPLSEHPPVLLLPTDGRVAFVGCDHRDAA